MSVVTLRMALPANVSAVTAFLEFCTAIKADATATVWNGAVEVEIPDEDFQSALEHWRTTQLLDMPRDARGRFIKKETTCQ